VIPNKQPLSKPDRRALRPGRRVLSRWRKDVLHANDEAFRALDALRDFLFERVYLRDEARSEKDKAIALVRSLFAHYLDHPEQVPEEYHRAPGDLPTRVADYIAGMTDRYALRVYEQLFLPQGWLL